MHNSDRVDHFVNGFENVLKCYKDAFEKNEILTSLKGKTTKPVFRKFL